MKELIRLMNEGKYQEAQLGFYKTYEENGNPIALYYITIIEYMYKEKPNFELIEKNFETLYNYSKDIRITITEYYIAYLLETNNYKKCLDVTTKGLKEMKETFLLCYGHSISLVNNGKAGNDKALTYALKSLEYDDVNETQKLYAYSNLIDIYKYKKEFDKAHETIKKLYLISSHISFINYIELRLAISEEKEEDIKQIASITINQEENKANTQDTLPLKNN